MRLVIALALLMLTSPAGADADLGNGVTVDDNGSVHYPNGDILNSDGTWGTEPWTGGHWVSDEEGTHHWVDDRDGSGSENGGPGGNTEPGHGSSDGGRGPK
jgi:hypothetical protein